MATKLHPPDHGLPTAKLKPTAMSAIGRLTMMLQELLHTKALIRDTRQSLMHPGDGEAMYGIKEVRESVEKLRLFAVDVAAEVELSEAE